MKTCNKCKIEKDENEFSRDKCKKDGLRSQCKLCDSQYYQNNKEHKREYDRKYVKENKEKTSKRKRKYNEEHNIERQIYRRKYYNEHKNHENNLCSIWAQNNPDKIRAKDAKRRSLKIRLSIIKFTEEEFYQRMSLWCGHCAYCGKEFKDGKLWEHIDHVIPIIRGGLHILANLRPTCAKCNLSKGAKLLKEWKNHE